MWAIVPLKAPALAKTRLAAVLTPTERRHWYFAMARHVIAALRATRGIEQVAVVTGDDEVAAFARGQGALVLHESGPAGTAQAFATALAQLEPLRLPGVLMVAGDLPLASPASLLAVLDAARTHEVVIVPDRLQRGTNALACTPADAVVPCFGEDSYRRHVAAAARAQRSACTLALDDLALDIDSPDDLDLLRRRPAAHGFHPGHAAPSPGLPARVSA